MGKKQIFLSTRKPNSWKFFFVEWMNSEEFLSFFFCIYIFFFIILFYHLCLSVFAHDDDDASIVFCRIIFNSNAMLPSWINSSVYRFQNLKWHSFFSFFLFVFTRCLFLDSYIQMSLFWLVLADSCVSGLLLFSFFYVCYIWC